MKKKLKLFCFILSLVLMFSLLSGCSMIYKVTAPSEYKSGIDISSDYPEDSIPIIENATVYEYSSEDKQLIVKVGTTDTLDDVSDFYMDFFEENEVFLTLEKDRSNEYLADGEFGYYSFEITAESPSGKWEERLYDSIVEIKLTKVNIPEKNLLYKYIAELEADFIVFDSIFDINTEMDNSDSDDFDYYTEAINNVLESLADLEVNVLDRIIPENNEFSNIHNTEIELISILKSTFNEYNSIIEYSDVFLTFGEDLNEFLDKDYEYYYDEFIALIPIFNDFADELEYIYVPSFIEDFNSSLISTLRETAQTSEYCVDAIDYEDNVRFYAGLYSYNKNFRDFLTVLTAFENDITLLEERIEEEITLITDMKNGLSDWVKSAKSEIEADSESITKLSDEYILDKTKNKVVCDYLYPDEIIPANYRSLDYIAFMQLSTDKGISNVNITVEIPGFTQKFEQKLEVTHAESEVKIHPPLVLNAVESLNTNKDAQLVITVEDLDNGEIIVQDSLDITIYSRYDMQWYDDNDTSYVENILAWVTPEAPQISTLLRSAADSAFALTNDLDSMIGYQQYSDWEDYEITYVQTAAIMHALATELGVKYVMEPFSSTNTTLQRVKTPAMVIDKKSGLCAETAVTVASALQSMGMHPVLILLPGHMQVAVETWHGSCDYFLIETTALSSAANQEFKDVIAYLSQDEWHEYLNRDGYIVIDCDLAEQYGIKSID